MRIIPKLPLIASALFTLSTASLSPLLGEAYIDEQNRLVLNGRVFSPPELIRDTDGTFMYQGVRLNAPNAEVLADGSLLFDGVIYPVPDASVHGSNSFEAWKLLAFPEPADRDDPAVSGPYADPGNLGVPNLIRYALGLRANAPAIDILPRLGSDATSVSLSFPFIGPRNDVRIEIVASSDLLNWNEVLWDSSVDGASATPGSWVSISTPKPANPAQAKRFLRLRISAVPD